MSKRRVVAAVLLLAACGLPVATSGNWAKRARDALSAPRVPWVTIVSVETPCRITVRRANGETVLVRLKGIAPISESATIQTQAVRRVAAYVFGLTNLHTFFISLDSVDEKTGDGHLGTLMDPDYHLSLQDILVNEGYAQPTTNSSPAMWQGYERAKQEKKGLWALLEEEKKKGTSEMNGRRP